MGSSLHFILLFSGLWALASCVVFSRQFYLVKYKLNWTDAQAYCRENYTDLATIENDEEMNTVKKMVENVTTSDVWIGLKQVPSTSSEFGNRSWVWSDNTTFNNYSYSYWNYGEPNNNGTENCVQIKRQDTSPPIPKNTWIDSGCQYNCMFVCYKRRTPIIVIPENKTWKEARRYCRQNHVDLVSVYSQEMQDWVETVTSNISTNLWIGLRHTRALGFWYWVKGEMICYQNWAPENRTGVEDCTDVERTGAMLSGSKKWISLPETQELGFICIS